MCQGNCYNNGDCQSATCTEKVAGTNGNCALSNTARGSDSQHASTTADQLAACTAASTAGGACEYKAALMCYQRTGRSPIPGCNGDGIQSNDYCYDAIRYPEFDAIGNPVPDKSPNLLRSRSPSSASPGAGTLTECEGQCDHDSECATGLKCFHRRGIMATIEVPGCGDRSTVSGAAASVAAAAAYPGTSYCYNPITLTEHTVFDFEGNVCPAPCIFKVTIEVLDQGIPPADQAPGCGSHCVAKTATSVIDVEIVDVNEPPALTVTAQTSFLLQQVRNDLFMISCACCLTNNPWRAYIATLLTGENKVDMCCLMQCELIHVNDE